MKHQAVKILLLLPRKIRKLFYLYWNRFILFSYGVKYGKNLSIYNKFYINKSKYSSINIGDNFTFTSGEAYNPLSRSQRGCFYTEQNATIEIGNNTGISSSCIWAANSIKIGSNVLIGADCIIMDTDCHSLDYRIRQLGGKEDKLKTNTKPIIIEDNVLLGTHCIVLKGTTIGARSIIGSGSIVTKSIPPDCIAGGNPCRVLKNNKK